MMDMTAESDAPNSNKHPDHLRRAESKWLIAKYNGGILLFPKALAPMIRADLGQSPRLRLGS